MIKYPIGIQSFAQIVSEGWVYVDKTALIHQMVTTSKICFLSRPRRFGKSLLVSTLECYFKAQKDLFKGLAMEQLEQNWIEYPVFKIDFNGVNFTEEGTLHDTLVNYYITEWENDYGKTPTAIPFGKRFEMILKRAYEQTGHRAVVLIDEYDKPLLDVLETPLEAVNREILKAFYSTFKGADAYLQFVLLTGVTKFSQISVFSGFNQPDDISMDTRYEALCGISQEELESYFKESIASMAEEYLCSTDEMKAILKKQYDGYHFGKKLVDIYNPFSLLNAFKKNNIYDYWYASGTPTYLQKLLKHNNEQMNDITGKYYSPEMFIDYKADVEKPLPMIYQSGYLTIKDFDLDSGEYLLDFPNEEVRKGFLTMIANGYFHSRVLEMSSWISSSIRLLKNGKTDEFRDSLTAFLSSIPYNSHESVKSPEANERHFQYTFYLILRLLGGADCRLLNEQVQAKGRVDCIIEYTNFIYIFEFKLDGSADDALKQIEEKNYAKPYLDDSRKLIKIGVNFSSETRTVTEWKETAIERKKNHGI